MIEDYNVVENFVASIRNDIRNDLYRQELLIENAEQFKANLKKLQEVTKESCDLEALFLSLGLKSDKYKFLSVSDDSVIYDIIETYELGILLARHYGSWDLVWDSIKKELGQFNDEYEATLLYSFEELRNLLEYNLPREHYKHVLFENFTRNNEGILKMMILS
jgi:hypothetical protein